MSEFLKRVIGSTGFQPPRPCLNSFLREFGDAVRTDWSVRDTYYEAIFYKDSLEHIACYDSEGILLEYRMFLPREYLPSCILDQLADRGEVMNSVLINQGNSIQYEVIIRDQEEKRYLLLYSGTGRVLEESRL
jgi:hypothetical protein